ncbi:BMP family ABC transporter substrate-binding protein [uncultured Clostridium sp.]|uniref:BMP family ABC transporter substrate-binding protein n=1 Tax=uncultured Clostridium sp. TaxID=59620 RepID=UPI0026265FC6|nr:BMP family ABC transporter substrate-binding protein [uncultured Clostridium sp.]
MERIKANKEILILLLIVLYLYVIMTMGGCAGKTKGNRYMFTDDLNVALICEDYQGEPYLEIAKKGVMDAGKELSMHPKIIALNLNEDTKKINKEMNKAALNNNLVIIVGGWLKDAVKVSCRQLRSRNFAVIDQRVMESNVKSVIFKNEEGAFLMGIIAGGETKTNKVGFIGGLNDEEGVRFLSGYATGVKEVNEQAYTELIDYSQVRYTEDFKDENKAYEKARNLYRNGCDIIFHACGSSGKGVFKAAYEMNKKAIGVDVDCAEVYPEYKKVIMSSMVKNLDKTILKVCNEIRTGSFKCGENNILELGLKEGVFNWAKNTEENVSKETFNNLNKYKEIIIEGIIEVPDKRFKVTEFKIG